MHKLFNLLKYHQTKITLMGLSSLQVFANFFISLMIIRKIGVGAELDVYYIENISFLLDLYVLFKTIPAVIFKKGAY